MKQEWIAAYYPSEIMENQRVKTIFSLLFDKVICNFPIAHTGCGGGVGISSIFDDDPLVEEGVLDIREKLFLPEVPGDWRDVSRDEFNRYLELNIAGMALKCAEEENAVPVTDKFNTPIPISMLTSLDINRNANLQAHALAIQSLDLSLPAFATLTSVEILKARDLLKDQLIPFRSSMLTLAPLVRSGLLVNAPIEEVYKEAKYVVETTVIPNLEDLKNRLKRENKSFGRKLIHTVAKTFPSIALKWISGSGVVAAIDSIKLAGGMASYAINNKDLMSQLLSNGGLGYLFKCQDIVNKKFNKPINSKNKF